MSVDCARRLFGIEGGAEVDVQRSGRSGRTVLEWGGSRPLIVTYDGSGKDLRDDDTPGPMWPELVLLEGQKMWILFRVHDVDLVSWDWIFTDGGKGQSLGRMDIPAEGCSGG